MKQEIKPGQVYKCDNDICPYAEIIKIDDDGTIWCWERNRNWELIDRAWYHDKEVFLKKYTLTTERYAQGTVLVDRDGDERKILGICGDVYLMSSLDNFDAYGRSYTKQELDKWGYKLKDSPQEEVIEVTMDEMMDEVAKLKGVDVSKIKVIKE